MKSIATRIGEVLECRRRDLYLIGPYDQWESDELRRIGEQVVDRFKELQRIYGPRWDDASLLDLICDIEEEEVP